MSLLNSSQLNYERTVTALKFNTSINELTRLTIVHLERNYSWFAKLSKNQQNVARSTVHLGLKSFGHWLGHGGSIQMSLVSSFGVSPTHILNELKLEYLLQICQACSHVIDQRASTLCETSTTDFKNDVNNFSRESLYCTSEAYINVHNNIKKWDPKIEASLIEAIVHQECTEANFAQLYDLGWKEKAPCTAVVGYLDFVSHQNTMSLIREELKKAKINCILSQKNRKIMMILSGFKNIESTLQLIMSYFGEGIVIYGPVKDNLKEIEDSAQATISALLAAHAWKDVPTPVNAEMLLPERVILGDKIARNTIIETIYSPLFLADQKLLNTLEAFLDHGGSLESTAKYLRIHTNTVRYRLKRIPEIVKLNPTNSREAFLLKIAIVTGRLARALELPTAHLKEKGGDRRSY